MYDKSIQSGEEKIATMEEIVERNTKKAEDAETTYEEVHPTPHFISPAFLSFVYVGSIQMVFVEMCVLGCMVSLILLCVV